MSDLFDFTTQVPRFAVMGNPVAHSKSPLVHAEFGKQTGIELEYTAIHVDIGGFEQAVDGFKAGGGRGLNVTVPFKHEAWNYAEQRSDFAELAGAVNTLSFVEGKAVFGENTDGSGMVRDIQTNHDVAISGRRVLIIGAGGAGRGVLKPVADEGPESLVLANRTADTAVAVATELGSGCSIEIEGCGLDDIRGRHFDIVINATAASITDSVPDVDPAIFKNAQLAYDMMYNDQGTSFMRFARDNGVRRSVDGLGMLVEQAADSFRLWLGVRPDTGPVIRLLRP